jgi:hypothetical protein
MIERWGISFLGTERSGILNLSLLLFLENISMIITGPVY